jgi:hypothetical protein
MWFAWKATADLQGALKPAPWKSQFNDFFALFDGRVLDDREQS